MNNSRLISTENFCENKVHGRCRTIKSQVFGQKCVLYIDATGMKGQFNKTILGLKELMQ